MNRPAPTTIRIRFAVPLPIELFGGRTHWTICRDHYGKNGKYMTVVATCKETNERLVLADGRERTVTHQIACGFEAQRGTVLYQIFAKLVKEGRAEQLPEGALW